MCIYVRNPRTKWWYGKITIPSDVPADTNLVFALFSPPATSPAPGEESVARSTGCLSTSHGSFVHWLHQGWLFEMSLSRLDLQHSHLDHLDHLAPRPVSWLIVWVGFFKGLYHFISMITRLWGFQKTLLLGCCWSKQKGNGSMLRNPKAFHVIM